MILIFIEIHHQEQLIDIQTLPIFIKIHTQEFESSKEYIFAF